MSIIPERSNTILHMMFNTHYYVIVPCIPDRKSSETQSFDWPLVYNIIIHFLEIFYPELFRVELTDFETVATIGVGGFGRVDLVCLKLDRSRSYAMKKLKKKQIVDMQQQEHVYNEKCILESCSSPFIGK